MATITRKDMQGVFILLAVLYLLNSIGSSVPVLGVVIFLIMLALVWLSTSEYEKKISKAFRGLSMDIVFKVVVAVVFLGALLNILLIIGIGFIVGTLLMFSVKDTLTFDVMKVKIR